MKCGVCPSCRRLLTGSRWRTHHTSVRRRCRPPLLRRRPHTPAPCGGVLLLHPCDCRGGPWLPRPRPRAQGVEAGDVLLRCSRRLVLSGLGGVPRALLLLLLSTRTAACLRRVLVCGKSK